MYGILFSMVSVMFAVAAFTNGGWYLLLLWPSLSFSIVAAGYLNFGLRVFGKSATGRIAIPQLILLLPFLCYAWSVWRLLRIVKREKAYHQLTNRFMIGRRLLAHELPEGIVHIVDLTCEFPEPPRLRAMSYFSYPILDATAPKLEHITQWVDEVACLSGNTYIHCAEGHGRTGMFAALVLVKTGHSTTPREAIAFIKSKRPLVRLSRSQNKLLDSSLPQNFKPEENWNPPNS